VKQREATIPLLVRKTRLSEAAERLVQLYDAWGKPDEAARWRKLLDAGNGQKGEGKEKRVNE
jgi:hypothetical protein